MVESPSLRSRAGDLRPDARRACPERHPAALGGPAAQSRPAVRRVRTGKGPHRSDHSWLVSKPRRAWPAGAPEDRFWSVGGGALNGRDDRVERLVLAHAGDRARLDQRLDLALACGGRQHDDRDIRVLAADPARDLNPVRTRQAVVDEEDVGLVELAESTAFSPVGSDATMSMSPRWPSSNSSAWRKTSLSSIRTTRIGTRVTEPS